MGEKRILAFGASAKFHGSYLLACTPAARGRHSCVGCIGRLQYLAGVSAAQCHRIDKLRRWLSRSGISPMVIPAWRLRVGLPGGHVRSGWKYSVKGPYIRRLLPRHKGWLPRRYSLQIVPLRHLRAFRLDLDYRLRPAARPVRHTPAGLGGHEDACRLAGEHASRGEASMHVYRTRPDTCIPSFTAWKPSS
jgi:hypothetical protein